ncbi:RluA family pseudouridine synthase [uncultured Sphaerotilus sp.]|uniref:RluA family pseudouridine synthase n=1 Tax=uncultured Sphaerotilus sp. TaxID=474984 RepID=UPI0030CA37C5
MNGPQGQHEASEVVEDIEEESPEPGGAASPAEVECRQAEVDRASHGLRLDKWLVGLAPEFSRSHLQQLIEAGHVHSAGQVLTSASRKVGAGQIIEVALQPTAQSSAFRAEAIPLDVVYEDETLMVVHKPAGLVVHPAAGHWSGTLLNGLLAHHAGAASLARAGIVHRLDKDTSGLMVVAKTQLAQTALTRAIAAREVQREYLALVHGAVDEEPFTIEAPIGRDPVSRIRMAVVTNGKPARTDVTCLAVRDFGKSPEIGRVSAVRCKLHTGRTHQIRVHLARRGHPLLGDGVYGGKPVLGITRQALHATHLGLEHPLTGEWLSFDAALPDDLAGAWKQVTQA